MTSTRAFVASWFLTAFALAQEWRVVDRPTPMPAITADAVRGHIQVLDQRAELYEDTDKQWLLRPAVAGLPTSGDIAICHDPVRHRTLALVVGSRLQPLATYEWDESTWTQLAPVHTPTLSTLALTFDPVRNVVLALGRNEVRGGMDTWTWDGTDWTLRAQSGPPVPSSLQMTFDRARGRAVAMLSVFVGGSVLQTWEWDGTQWFARTFADMPQARDFYAFGYDERRQRCVFGGGSGSKGLLRDLWDYDGTAWRLMSGAALPMTFVGCTWAAHRNALVARSASGDLYTLNGANWTLTIQRERPPVSKLAYDARRGSTICFGGSITLGPATTFYSDTWEHNGAGWRRFATLNAPGARSGHVLWSDANAVWLWGGVLPSSRQSNETWRFNGRDWALVPTLLTPPGRANAGIAYDSARRRAVLFGGENNTGFLADTWEFDGVAWQQLQPATAPAARSKPAMAYDVQRQRTVLAQGNAPQGGQHQDAFTWDGQQWSPIAPVTATSPFGRATMAYDARLGRVVLFTAEIGQIGVFSWDGTAWTRSAGPAGYSPFGELQATTEGSGTILLDSGIVWRRGTTLAHVEAIGVSCPGAGNLTASTVPAFDSPGFGLEASHLDTFQPAVLMFGTTLNTLPINGCTMRIGGPFPAVLVADANGYRRLAMPVPPDPALRSAQIYVQMANLANVPAGFALSKTLRLLLGD